MKTDLKLGAEVVETTMELNVDPESCSGNIVSLHGSMRKMIIAVLS